MIYTSSLEKHYNFYLGKGLNLDLNLALPLTPVTISFIELETETSVGTLYSLLSEHGWLLET